MLVKFKKLWFCVVIFFARVYFLVWMTEMMVYLFFNWVYHGSSIVEDISEIANVLFTFREFLWLSGKVLYMGSAVFSGIVWLSHITQEVVANWRV